MLQENNPGSILKKYFGIFLVIGILVWQISSKIVNYFSNSSGGVYNSKEVFIYQQAELLLMILLFWFGTLLFGKGRFIKSFMLAGVLVGAYLTKILLSAYLFLDISIGKGDISDFSLILQIITALLMLLIAAIYLFWIHKKENFSLSALACFMVGILISLPLTWLSGVAFQFIVSIQCVFESCFRMM